MKWYDEFVSWAKAFFSVETEAEISQATQKFTSLKDMTEQLTAAAQAAVQEQLTGIQSQVTDLTQKVTDLTTAVQDRDEKITGLTAQVADLTTKLTEKEDEMAALVIRHAEERRTLSGEVARLTAGKKAEVDAETPGLKTQPGNAQKQTAAVHATQVTAFIHGTKAAQN